MMFGYYDKGNNMADTIAVNTGNTPSGRPGSGTRETSSAPDPVAGPTTAPATGTSGARVAPADSVGAVPTDNAALSPEDFKQDGTLRKDAVRRITENAPPRGGERSYNEITGQTTVTTTVGGQVVTFVEDGDTRGEPKRETAMDSLARASEAAEENK